MMLIGNDGSTLAGQHPAVYGTCFLRGHVASMESVIYAVRDARFPANLDSSENDCMFS